MLEINRDVEIRCNKELRNSAINHPIGHATEAILTWWFRQELRDNQGVGDPVRSLFEKILDAQFQNYRLARTLLAANVIAFFRVDKDWTKRHLLPLFRWETSREEAYAAWEGFLWTPRYYPPLFEVIKDDFLKTAKHFGELGRLGEQYAKLLTFIALEKDAYFNAEELRAATKALSPKGLALCLSTVHQSLKAAGDQRRNFWENRIKYYLNDIFPKDVLDVDISDQFSRICVSSNDLFPEALDYLNKWLQPLNINRFSISISTMHDLNLCARFPMEALEFLDLTVSTESGSWPPLKLKECLSQLVTTKPELETDPRYVKLHNYLRQRGHAWW